MEKFKLNNGVEIPCFGIGTFMIEPDDAERAVEFALTDEEMNEIAKINKNRRYYERTTASLMALSLYKPNFENQK